MAVVNGVHLVCDRYNMAMETILAAPAKQRKAKQKASQKWVKHYNRECPTVTRLDCEPDIK